MAVADLPAASLDEPVDLDSHVVQHEVPVQQGRYHVDGVVALCRHDIDGAGIVYSTALGEVGHHVEEFTLGPG
eukprot:2175718-Alexandrium_andersonii.AAC.1